MTLRKGFILILISVLAVLGWAGFNEVSRLDLVPGRDLNYVLRPNVWPQSPREVTFAVIGDAGTGGKNQFRVASMMAQSYELHPFGLLLTTGDNVYFGDVVARVKEVVDKPHGPLFDAGVEFRPVLGNHDVDREDGDGEELASTLDALNMPARYYHFTRGPVDFFALDSNNMDTDQMTWLTDRLRCSENLWQVVYLHHPPFSSGTHGSSLELRRAIEPTLVAGGADVVFAGHDHNYERTLPQQGVTYVVTGGGGSRIRRVGSSEFTAVSESDHHFVLVRVADNRMHVTVLDSDGEQLDDFALSPRSAQSPYSKAETIGHC